MKMNNFTVSVSLLDLVFSAGTSRNNRLFYISHTKMKKAIFIPTRAIKSEKMFYFLTNKKKNLSTELIR